MIKMYVVFICAFAINIVMKLFSVHMKSIVVLTIKYVSLDKCILSFKICFTAKHQQNE